MKRLKELIASRDVEGAWRRIASLLHQGAASYPVLLNLTRQAEKLEREVGWPAHLMPVKVAVLGGATIDMLAGPIKLTLIAAGLRPQLYVGGYNQFVAEMIDRDGSLVAFAPQVIVVVNTPYNIPAWPRFHDSLEQVQRLVQQACDFLWQPCRVIHDRLGCEIILNNWHPLPDRPMGNLGAKLPGDAMNFIRRLNVALGDHAPGYVHINDVAALSQRRGLDTWFDQRYWFHAKQPLAFACVAEYARNTAAIVGAILGRTKKCVVVDLDNTLWRGVIGDDGLEGIELGEGTAVGEAFKAFQQYLLLLKHRGVLLAVCSKNDERIARSVFTDHPETVLKLDDFVSFHANWLPKSDNLRAMAKELNLGLDAFVFLDDSPAEREQVRQALPEVSVPELTDDPCDYPRIIDAGRYFEMTTLTPEDRERTQTYQRRQAATEAMETATDLSSYLQSLQMKAIVRPFEEASMERITQLTNKTNQFNLTTRRVTLSMMRAIAADPAYVTRSVRLSDRFGDHGLISVFVAGVAGGVMTIENWLMSCRVLKRGVEQLLFNEILATAEKMGIQEIIGIYKPTQRNGLVKDHYKDLGFSPAKGDEGETRWRLAPNEAKHRETFIEIHRGT